MPPACWDSVEALAPKTREPVAAEGELHLRAAFLGVGVLGEDVEDHSRAVDGGPAEDLLQVALLGGRQLVVEDHSVGVDGFADSPQLLCLAPPDVGRRVRRLAPLHDAGRLVGARGVDEKGKLVEARLDLLERAGPGHHPYEHDLLPEPPVDERGGVNRHVAAAFFAERASAAGSTSIRATRLTGPASSAVEPPDRHRRWSPWRSRRD